ncbi:MAG: hypothetical protein DRP94_08610 [Candidatus Latescibacterota bacterium]|nr:MAG: hypothetical protein DRP94_08610 [Candidatus Latescibacterota bacterium]
MSTYLHYVGGLYTPEKFVEEARRIGVSRRIPLRSIRNLKWGDEVLCASWEPHKAVVIERGEEKEHSAGFKEGKARVFCSFKVTRLFVEDPDTNFVLQTRLRARDKIVSEALEEERRVERECGTYYTSGSITVDASIEEIYGIIADINPKAKVMIGGELHREFSPPVVLDGVPFTRTLYKLWDEETELKEGEVVFIQDHRIARTKKEREALKAL